MFHPRKIKTQPNAHVNAEGLLYNAHNYAYNKHSRGDDRACQNQMYGVETH